MIRHWFCKPYSVCKECQVHFEPVSASESRWGNLCPTHRKPVMERDQRKDRVMEWANRNWEKLEPRMKKENLKESKQSLEYMRAALKSFPPSFDALAQQQRDSYLSGQPIQNWNFSGKWY